MIQTNIHLFIYLFKSWLLLYLRISIDSTPSNRLEFREKFRKEVKTTLFYSDLDIGQITLIWGQDTLSNYKLPLWKIWAICLGVESIIHFQFMNHRASPWEPWGKGLLAHYHYKPSSCAWHSGVKKSFTNFSLYDPLT